MIRFLFLYFLTQALAQSEVLTRAYFIGKDQLRVWSNNEERLLNPGMDSDPFGAPRGEHIEPPSPSPLKKAPFKSPHFRKDDNLYDFKIFKEQLRTIEGKIKHLTYNQTTGRMIVRGESSTHWLFHSLAIRNAEEGAQLIELSLEFLEENASIFATSIRALPGQSTELKIGRIPNKLEITAAAQISYEDNFAECDFKIDGIVRNQPFKLHTGLQLINGIPHPIELGKTDSEQKPLTLYLTSHAILHGDVRKTHLILDEEGQPVGKRKLPNTHHELFKAGILDPASDKLLKAYRVPPTFITFLSSTSNNASDDPFGDAGEASEKPNYLYVKNRDPRIPAWPTDRIIDTKELFKMNGVSFNGGDFAVFNLETDTFFMLSSSTNHELIQGIIHPAGSWGEHRSTAIEIKLIESQIKPTPKTLGEQGQTTLFQSGIETLPGRSGSLIMGPIHLNLESQIDANDTIVETRLELIKKVEEETEFQFKGGLTLEDTVPQIIQSTLVDGKWQSLVLTGTIVRKSEDHQ